MATKDAYRLASLNSQRGRQDHQSADLPGAAGGCELCGRLQPLTFHHLVPRTCHSNKWFRKNFSREDMSRGIHLCYNCHSFLHSEFSEKELGRRFNTREAFLAHQGVQRFVEWVKRR